MSYRSVFKPGLFEGQTIIVTGGGSGIGRCTAHEIAALGAHVAITGRKPDKLATVKQEIEASGGSCETHAFDIREETQADWTPSHASSPGRCSPSRKASATHC